MSYISQSRLSRYFSRLGKLIESAITTAPLLVLLPELVLLEQIALGQAPFLHGLRRQESHLPLFDRFFGIYGPVRLPTSVHRSRSPLGFSARTLSPSAQGQRWDLPVPVQKASVRAKGLRPRGTVATLSITSCTVLPSVG